LVASHLAGKGLHPKKGRRNRAAQEIPAHIRRIENKLRERFNTGVSLHHGEKKGHIAIDYYGNDDLLRLLGELKIQVD